MTDLSRMRVSDAERNGVIERLQHAATEGRLDLDELEDRIAGTLAAKTWSDLDPLVDDLPVPAEPVSEPDEDDEVVPHAGRGTVRVASIAVLAASGLSIAGSFRSPWCAFIGLVSAVFAAILLLGPSDLSRGNRFALLAGLVLGLMPLAFHVMLLVLVGG
jgi:hypothetical protein